MRITTLKKLMSGKNKGVVFHFLNDLKDSATQDFKYMVVDKGILDMNGGFDIVHVDEKLMRHEILVEE